MTIDFSKVNKHNMLLWYRALKSGEFEQGQNHLAQVEADNTTHCCLGVACEVAMANGLGLFREQVGHYTYYSDNEGTDHRTGSNLPTAVQKWLGLTEASPQISHVLVDAGDPCDGDGCDCDRVTAIRANDSMGWTFDQIADAVYEFYELAEVDPEAARG